MDDVRIPRAIRNDVGFVENGLFVKFAFSWYNAANMFERDVPLQKELFYFVAAVFKYVFLKLGSFFLLILKALSSAGILISILKQKIILKLVWKRGTLIRPISHLGIISLAAWILVSGGIATSGTVFSKENQELSEKPSHISSEAILVEKSTSQTKIPENRGRDEVIKYRVQEGDTLSTIAQSFNISLDTLLYVNDLNESDLLAISAELTILPTSGVYYMVKSGDTVENIASDWKVEPQAIVEINWLEKPYNLTIGQKLVLPNAEPPKPVAVTSAQYVASTPSNSNLPVQSPVSGSGQFAWPTNGSLTRYFGWSYGYFHGAIDLANSCGTGIYAADSGYVDVSGWRAGGYGLTVWINHGNGYYSRYAHLSSTAVSAGQYVTKGQLIGSMGATGLAYGCHLHFVIERNGVAIDPLSVL